MPQTILAVLAIVVITYVALNQHRTLNEQKVDMVENEYEVMANGIAVQVAEYLEGKAFDANTVTGTVTSPTGLAASFPTGKQCDLTGPIATTAPYSDCQSLNDFHKMKAEPVVFRTGKDEVTFQVTTEVHYLDSGRNPTTTRSFQKEVIIIVQDLQPDGSSRMNAPVRLPRIYAYP